ncbi:bombyxin B-7-like isoform X2 [Wyeomyia smithii]|uniref:bombyxin B-7-like isoform X1 n=1 Tax=Wyeomyia smithii TaxID=174621 RepID=UPI002467E18F|nr:bombyxin B-7-like isoform X1 [Wyeomyia smithii]XP_055524367.1 bombyxin B-7-like isoform X2 [Wyeomyia smithii]
MKLELTLAILVFLPNNHYVCARAVRRSCGKYLADRISDICKARGGYTQLSTSLIQHQSHRRNKRGVVEECCKRSCTDDTLIQYCMELSSAEEQTEQVSILNVPKITTPYSTEYLVSQVQYTTKFPIKTIPIEVGTVRPEFININAKYMTNKRKQYLYYFWPGNDVHVI